MKVVWTQQAESMLDDALDYIGAERPAAALRWFDETMERVRSLEHFPDQGRIVPELQRPEIREVLIDPYRVTYHRDEQQVTILAVLHDRRLFDLGDTEEEAGPLGAQDLSTR